MPWRDLIPWKRWGAKRLEVAADALDGPALQRDMNRVFEQFWRDTFWMAPFEPFGEDFENIQMPRVDVEEGRTTVKVRADVPGLTERDVQLTLSPGGDVLDFRGERTREDTQEDQETGRSRYERHYGVVQRAIALPCPVTTAGAEATLKRGVLRVRLGKRDGLSRSKRIPIT